MGITICEAADAFLVKCEQRGIQASTLNKYRSFANQPNAWAESKGILHLGELSVVDMDHFYASWGGGKRSKAKKLERLKAFIKFCRRREWMEKDISADLEAPEGSSLPAAKTAFSDEELIRIYAASNQTHPKPPGPGYRPWAAEDVKDFILFSIHTGLRISDVVSFDISKKLKGNDVPADAQNPERTLHRDRSQIRLSSA